MTVNEAYEKLRLPKNLQEHHLRVAALIQIMVENWQGEAIDKQDVVIAGLFHDAANILKFKFDNPAMMGEDEAGRIDYWRQVQQEVREQYGDNIHEATIKMCQEIGLSEAVLHIIDGLEWDLANQALQDKNWPVALAIYADMRIGPFGIIPLIERLENLHSRIPIKNYTQVLASAQTLESTLQSHITVNLQQINNQPLSMRFSDLLDINQINHISLQ
jgi:hypothetical protein